MNKKKNRRSRIGIVSILTIIFIVLKLKGIIDWLWIWVISPIWISILLVAMAFAVILIAGRLKNRKW